MGSRTWAWVLVFILCAVSSPAQGTSQQQAGDPYVGTWTGTWDGAGTGGFELTLEKDKNGAIGGRVSVTGEPTYKATLKDIAFDGTKMTARYEFTPDPRGEVRLATTFDGEKATGTWTLVETASGNEMATGTWTVTKK